MIILLTSECEPIIMLAVVTSNQMHVLLFIFFFVLVFYIHSFLRFIQFDSIELN